LSTAAGRNAAPCTARCPHYRRHSVAAVHRRRAISHCLPNVVIPLRRGG
jgi:hypothetical protein